MLDPIPLGEEIWLRRDYAHCGGACVFREIVVAGTLFMQAAPLLMISPVVFLLYQTGDPSIQLAILLLVTVFIIGSIVSMTILANHVFRISRYYPLWLYAEQINPIQLTIHYLIRKSTPITLSSSTLVPKTHFRHYTTLTITDKNSGESATLRLLTPEEYDRFMQYWNAAQDHAID